MNRVINLILWIGTLCVPLLTRADVYSESAIKAAYLSRFVDYIEWPSIALSKPPFVVAVFNDDEVGNELTQLLAAHTLKAMPVRVQKIRDLRQAADAQVLYLGAIKTDDLRTLLDALAKQPILVVANDVEHPIGVSINFVRVNNRIHFEVSLHAAEMAGLKIDAGLLAVASKVYGVPARLDACDMDKSDAGGGCSVLSGAQ